MTPGFDAARRLIQLGRCDPDTTVILKHLGSQVECLGMTDPTFEALVAHARAWVSIGFQI